jgi:hypothetical protein
MRTRSANRFNKALTVMLGVGTLAGVLIWAKLRLVTDIPRTVLAEPEDEATPTNQASLPDFSESENTDAAADTDPDDERDEDGSSTEQP